MLKKITIISLLGLTLNAHSEQNYSIKVSSDNKVTTSKGINVKNIEILEGLEAAEYYREQLVSSIDTLAKSDTMRNLYESETLIEDLVYVDSFINNYQKKVNKTTVSGLGSYCGNNTFLDYTFRNSFYRFSLDVRASTGTVGPLPPQTPFQYVASAATTINAIVRTDNDYSNGQSLFINAASSVDSGLHSSSTQVPFIAQGTYFISIGECAASKVIRVEGTKSYTTNPIITSIQR
jgi:hypothetical protein